MAMNISTSAIFSVSGLTDPSAISEPSIPSANSTSVLSSTSSTVTTPANSTSHAPSTSPSSLSETPILNATSFSSASSTVLANTTSHAPTSPSSLSQTSISNATSSISNTTSPSLNATSLSPASSTVLANSTSQSVSPNASLPTQTFQVSNTTSLSLTVTTVSTLASTSDQGSFSSSTPQTSTSKSLSTASANDSTIMSSSSPTNRTNSPIDGASESQPPASTTFNTTDTAGTSTTSSSSSASSDSSSSSGTPASVTPTSPVSGSANNTTSTSGTEATKGSTDGTPEQSAVHGLSTSTSVVHLPATGVSTTMTSTITDQPESTLSSPIHGIDVTQSDGKTQVSFPALVTVLSTSREPDGSFLTYTHTYANPTGFFSATQDPHQSLLHNQGAVAGIFLAVGIVVTALTVCAFMLWRKRRRRQNTKRRWIEDMQNRPGIPPPDSPDNPFHDEPPMTSLSDPGHGPSTRRSLDRFYLDDGGPLIPFNSTANAEAQRVPTHPHQFSGPFSDANAVGGTIGLAVTTSANDTARFKPRALSPIAVSRQSTPSLYPATEQDEQSVYEEVRLNDSIPGGLTITNPDPPASLGNVGPESSDGQAVPPRPPRSILRAPSKVYTGYNYGPLTPPASNDGHGSGSSKPPSPISDTVLEKPPGLYEPRFSQPRSDIFPRRTLLNVQSRSRDTDLSSSAR